MNEPTDAETLRALQFALAPETKSHMKPLKSKAEKPKIVISRDMTPDYERERAEDDRREHEADLRHESLMADESEYGPRCNLPDDEGWRNV